MKRIRKTVVAMAFASANSLVQALEPREMTEEELRALPKWCAFTQSFDRNPQAPGHYDAYQARYGEGWIHVHHYCWALGSLIRYNQPGVTPQLRRSLASTAVADIDYVLRNAPDDFALRFEMLSRKARILIQTGSFEAAHGVAKKVAQEWPDRADSHGLVAETLLALQRRGEARAVLDQARSIVRDADRLGQIRSALKV